MSLVLSSIGDSSVSQGLLLVCAPRRGMWWWMRVVSVVVRDRVNCGFRLGCCTLQLFDFVRVIVDLGILWWLCWWLGMGVAGSSPIVSCRV